MTRRKEPFEYRPLTRDRWRDFTRLFGKNGAYGGCWCMWWRSKRSDFEKRGSAGNRRAMKRIVDSGEVPGIIAYSGAEPVGWCSVGPRENFPTLGRSPVLKPIDDTPVWSIVCFFVSKDHRAGGVGRFLIRAAIRHARAGGAKMIEAYPRAPKKGDLPPVSSFTGIYRLYEEAGFVEAARPTRARAILRRRIKR